MDEGGRTVHLHEQVVGACRDWPPQEMVRQRLALKVETRHGGSRVEEWEAQDCRRAGDKAIEPSQASWPERGLPPVEFRRA